MDTSVDQADKFVLALRNLIMQRGLIWHEPTVSHDERDHIVEISWWKADRSLLVTVELDGPTTYLKAWGANIFYEMDEGESPSDGELVDLWQWLSG